MMYDLRYYDVRFSHIVQINWKLPVKNQLKLEPNHLCLYASRHKPAQDAKRTMFF